jgi:hypothetical protein
MLVNSYSRNVVSIAASVGAGVNRGYVPEEIAVDAADSPHFANLGSHSDEFDPHMGALLDHNVGIVGELRWSGAGIIFDFVGDQLPGLLVDYTADSRKQTSSYMIRDEQAQGPGLRKEAMGIHRMSDGVDLVVSVRPFALRGSSAEWVSLPLRL